MKKALAILGGVFLTVLVIGAVAFTIFVVVGKDLDSQSKAYADAVIPAVIANWDIKELDKRASPELLAAVKRSELEGLFVVFQKLGKLKEYKGSKGQANISLTTQSGKVITANYVGNAEFENGPASVQLVLIRHADQWQILGFRVNSKVLLQQ